MICLILGERKQLGRQGQVERGVKWMQKSTTRIMNIKHFFSASKAVVIVACKEACNEVKEYGISNLCIPNARMQRCTAESMH